MIIPKKVYLRFTLNNININIPYINKIVKMDYVKSDHEGGDEQVTNTSKNISTLDVANSHQKLTVTTNKDVFTFCLVPEVYIPSGSINRSVWQGNYVKETKSAPGALSDSFVHVLYSDDYGPDLGDFF